MKIFAILMVLAAAAFANSASDVSEWAGPRTSGGPLTDYDFPMDVLFDNGPFVTGVGQGSGGADISEENDGETTYGFGFQIASDIAIADQFEVVGANWMLSMITVYGYQTGSGTTPTINDIRLALYDDPPATGTLVYGDVATNVLTSNEWTNCYRVGYGQATNTDRPVMANMCDLDWDIPAGEYWLYIQAGGTGSSGPWANPVTITGQLSTGDAIQYYQAAWNPIEMGGTGEGQGIPFIVEGTTALSRSTWGEIKSLF